MFKITASSPDLKLSQRWIDKLQPTVDDPKVMSVGVKPIGVEIDKIFTTEGAHGVGSWRMLSMMTRELRRQRGYNPEHPILQQSRALRNTTAGSLRRWGVGTVSMAAAGSGITFSALSSRRQWVARISGDKVENNWGGRSPRGWTLPQRRFWGITPEASEKATEEISKRIMKEWAKKGGRVKVI